MLFITFAVLSLTALKAATNCSRWELRRALLRMIERQKYWKVTWKREARVNDSQVKRERLFMSLVKLQRLLVSFSRRCRRSGSFESLGETTKR